MLESSCLFSAQEYSVDKNTRGKNFWHELILRYEKAMKDYDFGSLIPVDVEDEHSQYIFGDSI
ncbi:hypothetical protein M422DRAFT_26315 [Sphaerobolus stellatus SS14]|nr:hypothetical protein M422DRAFT_26315 [Sphaerobolus stellatus SS14]